MKNQKLFWLVFCTTIICFIIPVMGLDKSLSDRGINALILHEQPYNLLGRKIAIGQVEIGRAGKFGLDKVASKQKNISVAGSFFRDKEAKPNANIDNHAFMVASVMVSNHKKLRGIAPKAKLYSSAIGLIKKDGQGEQCLSAQHIAKQNNDDVRAINFSFGESLDKDSRINPSLDGNALLTQCIDWSARVHNTLYVVAGNQGSGGIPIPTDNYNGITTAYTRKKQGVFNKLDFANLSDFPRGVGSNLIKQEINEGERRSISLLAPGDQIQVYNLDGKIEKVSGTSFAAPHVTASVALLQEAGDNFLYQKKPLWTKDYRNAEVMKAILLNSADKIKDNGDGNLLGMTRTIFNKKNKNWLQSDAYFNPQIPLDISLGVGHLNILRAYNQLVSGEWSYQQKVANFGWNYDVISANLFQDYVLDKPLKKNSFVSITLVWNRLVELKDFNNNQQYDMGESFENLGLNNLDLFFISDQEKGGDRQICSSISKVDSIEHIFCKIPENGNYKIRVNFAGQVHQNIQPYALAWQTVSIDNQKDKN